MSNGKVNIKYIEAEIEKDRQLRDLVVDKYTPAIFDNIKQYRTWVTQLPIIAGAIAAFSLNIANSNFIKNQSLFTASLFFFLFVIAYSVFYLKVKLENENKSLAGTYDQFISIIETQIQWKKKLLSGERVDQNKIAESYDKTQKILSQMEEKGKNKKDYSGDILLATFIIGLVLITLSMISIPFGIRILPHGG